MGICWGTWKNWWLGVVQRNYKCAFNLTRLAAVWRRLLIFYIAMCLAGYAKSLHDLIFWPSFVVLVLLLWEPYVSPPLTWVSGAEQTEVEDGKSKINTGSTEHCEKRMADDIKRWHWAIQDGINPTQMAAYMCVSDNCCWQNAGGPGHAAHAAAESLPPWTLHAVQDSCIAITGLSYTATNLLYDFDSNPPVGTEWQGFGLRDLRCCGQRAASSRTSADSVSNQATSSNRRGDSATSSFSTRSAKPRGDAEGTQGCLEQAGHVIGDVQVTCMPISDSNSRDGGSISSGQRPAQHPSPPFLKYNKPAGIRGWGIIVLLCAVLVPSVVLWGFVTHGLRTNQYHMFLTDKDNSCRNGKAFERCFKRYVAMLYLLGLCGVVSCYYALTVGVLASGPVTCMFRVCAAARMTKQDT